MDGTLGAKRTLWVHRELRNATFEGKKNKPKFEFRTLIMSVVPFCLLWLFCWSTNPRFKLILHNCFYCELIEIYYTCPPAHIYWAEVLIYLTEEILVAKWSKEDIWLDCRSQWTSRAQSLNVWNSGACILSSWLLNCSGCSRSRFSSSLGPKRGGENWNLAACQNLCCDIYP